MNCIVLEGLSLYALLIMIVLLLVVAVGSIVSAILSDRRNFTLINLLLRENNRVKNLIKENFILRIRHGEFYIDEE